MPSLAPEALGEGELAPEASLEDLPPEGLFLPKSGIVVTLSEIHSKPNFVHMRHFLCCQLFLSSVSATVLLLCSDVLSLLLYLKDLPVALRLVPSSCSTSSSNDDDDDGSDDLHSSSCSLLSRIHHHYSAKSAGGHLMVLPRHGGLSRETRPSGPKLYREGRAK